MGNEKNSTLCNDLKSFVGGWGDGSVKSTDCSSRGSRCNSWHPHKSSQPSAAPFSGNLLPSFGLMGTAYMWYIYMHASKTVIHINKHLKHLWAGQIAEQLKAFTVFPSAIHDAHVNMEG